MKKQLNVTINKPLKEVFDFVLDPRNTYTWIDAIKHEETDEFPVRRGTIYHPFGEGAVALGDFPVTEFEDRKSFTYTRDGSTFSAKYTFTPVGVASTKMEYLSTDEEGDLSDDPVDRDALQKLKHAIEHEVTSQRVIAREIIKKIRYANIATVTSEGLPWNTPVFYLYDEDMNIYWLSDKSNQHSQNVRSTPKAFITIYDSTVPVFPSHNCAGVYFSADVVEINDLEAARVALGRFNMDVGVKAEDCVMSAVRRIYRATPNGAWTNGAEVKNAAFLRDFRVALNLGDVQHI
jgi:nitroimidazol reductase NimA-like FMN-containing flavoprotein (pyridoxamine 5'-phosphate oxidase superfamily)